MADEDDDWTEEEEGEDIELGAQKAGAAFRAEMWATDFFLGNWMYLAGVLVLVLVGVFVYSQYAQQLRREQLAGSREVAEREVRLDAGVADLAQLLASGQTIDEAKMAETAAELEAVDSTGAARAEAMIKAAELYRIAGKVEEQKRALEAASATGVEPVAALAELSLANIELEAGDADAATARLQKVSNRKDFLGEQASIDLAMMYEHLGNTAEAKGVYDDFETRFPESPRLEMVKKRRTALENG